jgi:hypothetical protein
MPCAAQRHKHTILRTHLKLTRQTTLCNCPPHSLSHLLLQSSSIKGHACRHVLAQSVPWHATPYKIHCAPACKPPESVATGRSELLQGDRVGKHRYSVCSCPVFRHVAHLHQMPLYLHGVTLSPSSAWSRPLCGHPLRLCNAARSGACHLLDRNLRRKSGGSGAKTTWCHCRLEGSQLCWCQWVEC